MVGRFHKEYILLMILTIIIITGCSINIHTNENTTKQTIEQQNIEQKTNIDQQNIQGENMKKIAMIIAPKGYQDTEFGVPYQFFKDHGAQVDVYSTKKGLAKGSINSSFNVEHTLSELNVSNYNAVMFVGGPGTPLIRNDSNSIKIVKDTLTNNKTLGAICWSPTILAKAGVLKGKNATVWYGPDSEYGMLTSEYLQQQGAKYTAQDVTVDGNIITADGPASAQKYAEAVWKKLTEKQQGH